MASEIPRQGIHPCNSVRLPAIAEADRTAEQRAAVAEFAAERGYSELGPFSVMLRSPQVMLRMAVFGSYVRFKSSLPKDITEMVILQTARGWSQSYEWTHHAQFARQEGLPNAVVEAIADGRRPEGLSGAHLVAYDFTAELQTNKRVSDATYARAVAAFDDAGVLDLVALQGYYTMLAMMLNVAQATVPEGAEALGRWPE
jgi:4-carboxymuconolactone decarboxylase